MATVLYRRQKQIVNFLNRYIEKFGHAPTLVEIAKHLGVRSLATVHEHLQVLEKKGLIKKISGISRGIELIDQGIGKLVKGIELPILGFIAAGAPIEPYTDPNSRFTVPDNMISPSKKSYVLQVKGESMIEEGILDGDFVVVEEANQARDGDIVVAMIDNGVVTLKRFFKEKDRVRLEPANSSMEPIFAKNVIIQGKCVGVIRRYNY
ncbi:repressor LexA [Candidatus Curtissbacteria bacterium RIFOXYB1_FULL_41_59]|uniref:LexA repressor n=1 Tax=Candidatus Curtissbacteria bacterium RIFOXYA1_FULL_41_14 TaxID=1797737 RepID=A0A1F5HBM5_9BACT|nr:MAG: LexA repressor [Candidatus Curtissbacteria bacterium GW2011_GWB1_40_28]KKR60973.1 MAG: LexA repressor [Candidatus Curtissbacteria bacterium GW2011_GWA2_40_31]KKR61825.1 MAG: LexA repressor [Microgenomates group bacterium GW2011_GWC1_40_35]KKS01612.1 MAG: LexA repressor [Candidatus Curtissbacteria bacterium GW2011_GWC2_41_21]OGD92789.1 MAG: repressor LexA [Candidatus Curtissbacteria bacterium RIFCSPHIGHO2_12_FULL_41_13]OGE01480.1 MAG: repressor LexA [Candidatus Curtissbacteria bacterium